MALDIKGIPNLLFNSTANEGEVSAISGFGTLNRKLPELKKDYSANDNNITTVGTDTITSVKIDVEVGDIIQISFSTSWQPAIGSDSTVFQIHKDGVNQGINYSKEDLGGIGSDTFSFVWSEVITADGSPTYSIEAQSQGAGTEDLYYSDMSVLRI